MNERYKNQLIKRFKYYYISGRKANALCSCALSMAKDYQLRLCQTKMLLHCSLSRLYSYLRHLGWGLPLSLPPKSQLPELSFLQCLFLVRCQCHQLRPSALLHLPRLLILIRILFWSVRRRDLLHPIHRILQLRHLLTIPDDLHPLQRQRASEQQLGDNCRDKSSVYWLE